MPKLEATGSPNELANASVVASTHVFELLRGCQSTLSDVVAPSLYFRRTGRDSVCVGAGRGGAAADPWERTIPHAGMSHWSGMSRILSYAPHQWQSQNARRTEKIQRTQVALVRESRVDLIVNRAGFEG